MAKIKYVIKLSDSQRKQLDAITNDGKSSQKEKIRAQILLLSDTSQNSKKTVLAIADELNTTHTTIQSVKEEFVEKGIDAVFRKKRVENMQKRRISTFKREQIRNLAKEDPPAGHRKWSLRLLATEAQNRGIVDSISADTVATILEGN